MADQQPTFAPQRIYIKDASFEAPGAPLIFLEKWQPDIKIRMDNSAREIDGEPGVYEAVLKVNVEATLGDKAAYIAEVVQGGVFSILGFSDQDRARLTAAVCPEILYSYAREAVSNLIVKGGFPAFLLNPINFGYIYEQRLRENQARGETKGEDTGGKGKAKDKADAPPSRKKPSAD